MRDFFPFSLGAESAYSLRMFRAKVVACCTLVVCAASPLHAQRRHSDDKDLLPIDISAWECLKKIEGTAKTQDGVERNRGKNRGMVDLSRLNNIPSFDIPGFLKAVAHFDSQTQGKRRDDLSYAQKIQLASIEREIVSVTGYLVLAYPGGPETTNCGEVDFHDWHLEIFDRPLDHPPGIGDPTALVCEITPRMQTMFYEQGVRLQDIAAYMRRPDSTHEDNGHPARKIRFTGYVLWDDDHNGSADVGPLIREKAKNGYHRPWRLSAFEIHPILKIEVLDAPPPVPASAASATPAAAPGNAAVAAPASAAPTVAATPAVPAPPAAPQAVTILQAVRVKIPYGETLVPAGTRAPILSRTAQSVTVRYLGQDVVVPLSATDLARPAK